MGIEILNATSTHRMVSPMQEMSSEGKDVTILFLCGFGSGELKVLAKMGAPLVLSRKLIRQGHRKGALAKLPSDGGRALLQIRGEAKFLLRASSIFASDSFDRQVRSALGCQ